MLNVESYNYGTLPSQIPIWKMEHESTAEINSLLLTEISESWRTSVIGVVEVKIKMTLGKMFLLSLPSCGQRMMWFALQVHSKSCLRFGLHISDDYFAIKPPETPISLRSSLYVSQRVCIVVSFPER